MSWLPKRDKFDPVQASVIDFAVAQEGNFYIKGEELWGHSPLTVMILVEKQCVLRIDCKI